MPDRPHPLQNRVSPEGDIVAAAARGTMMGNRGGALHGADKRLGRRRWVSRQWIACRLEFNGRHRQVMTRGRYTELFFLDEATALAAGHRPCFECRRSDSLRFAVLWARVDRGARPLEHPARASALDPRDRASAGEMDRRLHAERVDRHGHKVTYREHLGRLPRGAFVRVDGKPWLVHDELLLGWTAAGYAGSLERIGSRDVDVLTPRSIVAVLSAGYRPSLHPTASRLIARPTS